jgi:hypothetical protein
LGICARSDESACRTRAKGAFGVGPPIDPAGLLSEGLPRRTNTDIACDSGEALRHFGHGWQKIADFVTAITVAINHSAEQPYREG